MRWWRALCPFLKLTRSWVRVKSEQVVVVRCRCVGSCWMYWLENKLGAQQWSDDDLEKVRERERENEKGKEGRG